MDNAVDYDVEVAELLQGTAYLLADLADQGREAVRKQLQLEEKRAKQPNGYSSASVQK